MRRRLLPSLFVGAISSIACGAQETTHAARDSRDRGASEITPGAATTEAPRPSSVRAIAAEIPLEAHSPLWLHGFGDAHLISSLASDGAGNVLVARSGFELAKLDPNGSVLWSRPFGALVAARGERTWVAGTLDTSLMLGSFRLDSHGGSDVYVAELDAAGNVLGAVSFGGGGDETVQSLAVAGADRVVISGKGLGTLQLDAGGRVGWSKSFYGYVATNSLGETLLTGALRGSADYGGGLLTSQGGADVVVVKLAPNGEHLSSRSFGDAGELQEGQSIVVDGDDAVVIGGIFEGTLDFGAGPLTLTPGSCSSDAWCRTAGFVVKLDAQGRVSWSVARTPLRALSGVAVDRQGRVITSGALPGGVTPFHIPWASGLDAAGAEAWRIAEWPETGVGAGYGVALDPAGNLFWSLSVRPTLTNDEQSYLAKLSP